MRFGIRLHIWFVAAMVAIGWLAMTSPARAASITLNFDDSIAEDVFVYEFLASQNMDNFSFPGLNFGTVLGTANTGGSGHDVRSLLRFDLAGLGLFYPAQVQSAQLKMRVIDAKTVSFPVVNPSKAFPVDVDVFALAADWNEQAVTWSNQPATVGDSLATTQVNGFNQTISFSLTDAVKSWVSDPASNFGLLLTQLTAVRDSSDQSVGVVFASSAFGSNVPVLEIELTPEKPGDANFDGFVDAGDYTTWADNFLQTPRTFAQGDFNHDGIVDAGDYTIWADNFDPFVEFSASAVPEPATWGLIASALPLLLAAGWRRLACGGVRG